MDISHIIGRLIVGAIIGFFAARITKSEGGLIRNIIIGICGSYLGSVLANTLHVSATSLLSQLAFSIAGACILLVGGKALFK